MTEHRTLILMRHAKSDWPEGQVDIVRPLSERGRRQAPESGRWLALCITSIDLAVVSPAERARSTWTLVSAELAVTPTTRIDDRVYAASDTDLLEIVQELPEDVHTVIVVGHNPTLEQLVTLLTGERVTLPTSALAVITMSAAWSSAGQSSAVLQASGRPPAL